MTLSQFVADKVKEHLVMLAKEGRLPYMKNLDLTEVVQNAVEQHKEQFRTDVLDALCHYLANDPGDLPSILEKIESTDDETQDLESMEGISVWEPLEGRWTIGEFKAVIGL